MKVTTEISPRVWHLLGLLKFYKIYIIHDLIDLEPCKFGDSLMILLRRTDEAMTAPCC
jgi:hypothetical protein